MIKPVSSDCLDDVDLADAINWDWPVNHGLVACWAPIPALAGGWRWYDLGPKRNYGDLIGGDWTPWRHGGYALDLDGSTEYVACDNIPTGWSGITVLAWGWPHNPNPGEDCIVSQDYFASEPYKRDFFLVVLPSGVVRVRLFTNAANAQLDSANWQWSVGAHQFGFRWGAGQTLDLIYDGRVVKSGSLAGATVANNGADFQIGRLSTVSLFDGLIGQVAVWSRRLSEQEIARKYLDDLQGMPRALNRVPGWLPSAAGPPPPSGPYQVQAGCVYTPGSIIGQTFTPGSAAGQSFTPGSAIGQTVG